MDFKKELGARIKLLRIDLGITQAELARRIDVDPQTVRDYESGKRSPTVGGFRPLADALEVTPSSLIDISPNDDKFSVPKIKPAPANMSDMVKLLSSIPDEIYDLALKVGRDNKKAWGDVKAALESAIEEVEEKENTLRRLK